MGKPSGGGGPGSSLFSSRIVGPPPGPLAAAKDEWINLGLIPVGKKIWFGVGVFTAPDKSLTFEIRTSLAGQSAGSDAATLLLASAGVSPTKGAFVKDMYRSGRLHTVTVVGTGVESFWLRLKSNQATLGQYLYDITFTEE